MRDEEQIIKIPESLIKGNYVQITLPFRKNFTLFSTDFKDEGLICHYNTNKTYQNINNYQSDERRKLFPNYKVSVYKGINGKYYINQILELDKQYFVVTQSTIINLHILKVKDNCLLLKRNLNVPEYVRSFDYSVGKLLCSINSIIALDYYGNLYYNIENLYQSSKEFIINGGGLLIQEDENLNVNFKIIEIEKSNSPYYYHVKEYQIPTSEYIYQEKNKRKKIKELSIPRIKRRCSYDTKD